MVNRMEEIEGSLEAYVYVNIFVPRSIKQIKVWASLDSLRIDFFSSNNILLFELKCYR